MNVPDDKISWGILWRPYHGSIRNTSDFYTKRNLWALSKLNHEAKSLKYSDIFRWGLTGILYALSKMQRYSKGSGFPNMILTGTYYVPQIGREIEVLSWFKGKLKSIIKGFNSYSIDNSNLLLSTSNACVLSIPSNSIDMIFTDPPYADKVQYGELNFLWEAWLAEAGAGRYSLTRSSNSLGRMRWKRSSRSERRFRSRIMASDGTSAVST